ncbi:GNAT family N-acetyltransferase [Bacillus wiedmannii]|uniref:GNAT family N-acetyltransferase n=1 Tax=Bacillus wiedmannii TaxID=1890302 RepID=A0A2B5J3N6_9BACI|nr:GNAT family N-acetyltransferase [Bacillus wiedmannii]PEL79625.1 GNAT family N-acetyltransferase [Bacillus wiedmannii]PEM34342.1 GNAT family N-acetyltransferase [Bacillus wiedmannii]PEM51815.1 GNAT family N-acetyltransferase [Bacillus wiedmannii]PEM86090.1 GNAT family N-acetyltransferase [Bacillus wiedmannii]
MVICDLTIIQNLFGPSKKVLNGLPNAVTIEEIEEDFFYNVQTYKEKISRFEEICFDWELKRASIVLNKRFSSYNSSVRVLLDADFSLHAAKIEVCRELDDVEALEKQFTYRSIEETLSAKDFKSIWEQCMLNSGNQTSILNIDEHFYSVQTELGKGWEKSCIVFYDKNDPVGLSIPHIESGTENEGRLFYFGVMPHYRGKGISSQMHLQSLHMLKEMGATYYIGSTHTSNEKMQRVFWRNRCSVKTEIELYYKIFKEG